MEGKKLSHGFEGKVAIVTGGSRGLGLEISRALAAEGAKVVVASRKADACEQVAAQLTEDFGTPAIGVGCHVGRWVEVEALADRAQDEFGRVDVLINNAGMSPLYESLDTISEALFDKVFDVNLKGPFRLSALVASRMVRDGGGTIVNISSAASTSPASGELPYAAAKAGLNQITVGMAHAYGPTVRVNCVLPGPFLTDISTHWDMDAFEREAKERFALQRGGRPEEIIGAVLYLAGDTSSFTTGALLSVDGGYN